MSIYGERIAESAARELRTGAEIHTEDGYKIGEITRIEGSCAKVARPMRRDIWLRAEHLLASGDGFITSFARSDLRAYQLSGPVADSAEETADGRVAGVLLSPEEQARQRIHMQAELAAQRKALPHEHPYGASAPPDTGGTIGEPVEAELARTAPDVLAAALGEAPPRRAMPRLLWALLPALLIVMFVLWRWRMSP